MVTASKGREFCPELSRRGNLEGLKRDHRERQHSSADEGSSGAAPEDAEVSRLNSAPLGQCYRLVPGSECACAAALKSPGTANREQ